MNNNEKIKLTNNCKAFFLKIGEYEHMKNLYEKGELYFNTFDFFRNLEYTKDGRADNNEYCYYHYAGEGIKEVVLKFYPDGRDKEPIKLDERNGLRELTISTGEQKEYTHIYSLSSIDVEWSLNNNCIIDDSNFADTKNYVVLIWNTKEFIHRVTQHLSKYKLKAKFIEYVDKQSYTGEMGPFRKFKNYALQNEYRIAVKFNTKGPKIIHLGSLSDIAREPQDYKKFLNSDCRINYKLEEKIIEHKITNINVSRRQV